MFCQRRFGRDADGNLITMTDHTGSTTKTYTYVFNYRGDVSGEGKALHGENPFTYASYFHDRETNYYYLMARYYNPAQGRFLTKDPVYNTNLYIYGENNPISFVDYNGRYAFPLGFNQVLKYAFKPIADGLSYAKSKTKKNITRITSKVTAPIKADKSICFF